MFSFTSVDVSLSVSVLSYLLLVRTLCKPVVMLDLSMRGKTWHIKQRFKTKSLITQTPCFQAIQLQWYY